MHSDTGKSQTRVKTAVDLFCRYHSDTFSISSDQQQHFPDPGSLLDLKWCMTLGQHGPKPNSEVIYGGHYAVKFGVNFQGADRSIGTPNNTSPATYNGSFSGIQLICETKDLTSRKQSLWLWFDHERFSISYICFNPKIIKQTETIPLIVLSNHL